MSFFVPAKWADKRHDGQVLRRDMQVERAGIMALVDKPAPPFHVDRLFERPVMSPRAAVDDLGLSKADVNSWTTFLGDVVGSATYEPAVRQQVMERLLQEDWDPSLRRVVLQRSVQLYRDARKSIVTVDELHKATKLRKARAPRPYTGPGRRTGSPGDYQYDYDYEPSGGSRGGRPKVTSPALARMKPGQWYSIREVQDMDLEFVSHTADALVRQGDLRGVDKDGRSGFMLGGKVSKPGMKRTGAVAKVGELVDRLSTASSKQYDQIPKDLNKLGREELKGYLSALGELAGQYRSEIESAGSDAEKTELKGKVPYLNLAANVINDAIKSGKSRERAAKRTTLTLSQITALTDRIASVSPAQAQKRLAVAEAQLDVVTKEADAHPGGKGFRALDKKKKNLELAVRRLNQRLRKSLEKAEPKGGTYHRRVPKPDGGFRYFYDPDSYSRSKGAHHSGDEAKKAAMGNEVMRMATDAGHEGCDVASMKKLSKKYGRAELADHLKASCKSGRMVYKGKRFYLGKGK